VICGLFAWLISYQPAVVFSHNKPATSNQPAVLFSQNKSAPAISHQPNEQAFDLCINDVAALLEKVRLQRFDHHDQRSINRRRHRRRAAAANRRRDTVTAV
jgi:hypothetical protein